MFVFAVVFAWAVKAALIEPFALACMLQVFFKVTEGQEPNAEWRGRLTQVVGQVPQAGRAGGRLAACSAARLTRAGLSGLAACPRPVQERQAHEIARDRRLRRPRFCGKT